MSRLDIIHHKRSDHDHNFQEHVRTTRRTFLSAAAMGTAAAFTPLFAQGQSASGAAAAGAGCEGGGPRMIKMTMFLKRKAGLSWEAFIDHHIKKHGPLFRSIPEASEHVLRYIQTHPLESDASTPSLWISNVDKSTPRGRARTRVVLSPSSSFVCEARPSAVAYLAQGGRGRTIEQEEDGACVEGSSTVS
jgi:hypothetical protein